MMEFFGSVVLGIIVALSNAGGIGGGGFNVPIAIIFFQFNTKQAVALSNSCIFAASVTRFIFNYKQKHPQKDAKAIDYGIIMVMFPMVLLGSMLGVQMNVILPEAVILIFLAIILVLLSIQATIQAIKIRKRENKVIAEQQKAEVCKSTFPVIFQNNIFHRRY